MTSWLRRRCNAIGVYSLAVLLSTLGISYVAHETLLSPSQVDAVTGPQEGYYWPFVQYQIFLERMDNQVMRFGTGANPDANALNLQYALLQSKFNILSRPSELVSFFRQIPEYNTALPEMARFMRQLNADMDRLPTDPGFAHRMAPRFDSMRSLLGGLSNTVRVAELRNREVIANDFYQKRRILYKGGMLLWTFLLLWVGVLLQSGRRARKLLIAESLASEAAQDAIRSKNTFLGMVSHELRTPLQTILSSIDVLDMRKPVEDRRNSSVMTRLTSAAMQLEAQMRDLTDYARLDSGKLELRCISFAPGDLIRSHIEEYRVAATRKGLSLLADVGCCDGSNVVSDPYRLQQIVGNLVGNAIKYTEHGHVRVVARWGKGVDDMLCVTVEDTGPGISDDDMPLLYEPFTQIDRSATCRYDGAGMGLAIIKRLVILFKGDISVVSEMNRGTRFTVRLPMRRDSTPAPTRQTDTTLPGQEARAVLLVNDAAEARMALHEMLAQMGYRCDDAGSGSDALFRMAGQRYAAVLLDLRLGDMDGFAVASILRGRPGPNRYVPIIAIGALPPPLPMLAQGALFADFVSKPVRRKELAAKLKAVIRNV